MNGAYEARCAALPYERLSPIENQGSRGKCREFSGMGGNGGLDLRRCCA